MARSSRESAVPCNECSSEFFGKHNVCSIVGRKIVAQLPNSWQEHEMRIASNTKIQQIADCLVSTTFRDYSLQCETP